MDDRFIGSGSIIVNDTPTGREVLRYPEPEIDEDELPVQLYDVVTIGGYSYEVAGADEGFGAGFETVNGWFREQNHIFAAGQTAAQVNAGEWAYGERGDSETHFAIAAIPHGARNLIPNFEGHWWNIMVPASILFARAWGENATGGAIVLGLTIGKIQPQ
jgi:hypothetical protein